MKKVLALLAVIFSILSGSVFAQEKSWNLAMKPDKELFFDVETTLQSRTKMAMMFMPEQEVFFKMFVSKSFLVSPINSENKFETKACVATATIQHYVAGQPNSEMAGVDIDLILWTSGLGGRNVVVSSICDSSGKIHKVTGAPKKFVQFFENDLIFYPEKAVKVGDSWKRTIVQPLSIDPHQEPIICDVKVVYTLKRVFDENKKGEVAFSMITSSDYVMQDGKKTKAEMKLTRSGTMVFSMENCLPLVTKSKNNFELLFSPTNYIQSEEYYECYLNPAEKP